MINPNGRLRTSGLERGSVMWALLVALALMTLGTMFTASVITTVQRSKASTDAVMLTQHTDTAVASAISALNAGEPVGQAAADPLVTTKCEKVGARDMCFRYWAMPVPGTAVDPVRYDLVTHVWIDQGTATEPVDGRNVRAMKLPLEVITYQTTGVGMAPVNADGYVTYQPTPSGLFANAIHSFKSTNLEGPDVSVRSYNSQTGDTGTRNATVSSSGWISFGSFTQADRTVLFGGASPAGDHTSRCTGEGCEESGTRVVDATYATATEASVAWMRTVGAATCDSVWDGDWVTSAHSAQLPAGETCINGSLVVDTTTTMSSPLTTLFVNGIVMISDSLNAPLTGVTATPAALVIYSTGSVVSFDTPANTGIAAMIYAPLATCGTNPANTQRITYFGSLVCDTVSIGGEWEHLYDDAAIAEFEEPVPGAAKTYSPGVPSAVGFDEFLVPSGWVPNTCPVTPPAAAAAYWKLDEAAGLLAKDSKGSGLSAGWATPGTRVPGVCSNATTATATGAIVGTQPVNTVSGLTLEYWGKAVQGTSVRLAGVRVAHDATSHVTVTVGAGVARVPFTVQNPDAWHLYTVTVSTAGAVTLYVDGAAKGSAVSGVSPGTVTGPLTIGAGTGTLDEVVYYSSPLSAAQVADRFTWWTNPTKLDPAVTLLAAGTPFTAPALTNDGTTPTLLKVRWTVPAPTFPTALAAPPGTSFTVQTGPAAAGPWTDMATTAGTATTWSRTNPTIGNFFYRVCATYNGDPQCSAGVQILTMPLAVAPTITVGAITNTTAAFSWSAPANAATYQSQYRQNGGAWIGNATAADGQSVINHGAAQSVSHGPTGAGTFFEIRVRSVNAAGIGAWSAAKAAQMTLATPTGLNVEFMQGVSVRVGWTGVPGATDYVLSLDGVAYWVSGTSPVTFNRPIGSSNSMTIRARNAYTSSPVSGTTALTMPAWAMYKGQSLRAGGWGTAATVDTRASNSLVSPNGRYAAFLHGSGRFYIFDLQTDADRGYSTSVAGTGSHLVFQSDGNLVLRNAALAPIAWSDSQITGATNVEMQDDGNFVIYNNGTAVWALSWGASNPRQPNFIYRNY